MIVEVLYAVDFICGLLRTRGSSSTDSNDKIDKLRRTLNDRLQRHYDGHWHPKAPERGSGYRCIRFVRQRIDPLLVGIGKEAGFSDRDLLAMLPAELTLWVDPEEVSVRFGEDGSIGVIYGGSKAAAIAGSDSEPDDSALSTSTGYGSENDSDCPSPETVMPIDLAPTPVRGLTPTMMTS
jgi:protein Tob/BTG